MKYNLEDLHWQEFETLAFKVLQILIAPSVQYLKGGNDKGRDIVYSGSSDFNANYSGDWIFQAKHKSKQLDDKDIVTLLSSDLKKELIKVFVTNKLSFDNYILITNKELNADSFDSLHNTFNEIKTTYNIPCKNFNVISYQTISSCIDGSEKLKWSFPNIITHPDFQILIQNALNLHLENRRKGWITGMQKQRDRFVYTQFFQLASDKLSESPAIILSGPPKSGKTFNAEMLALNLSLYHGFQPILVETIDDMEYAYNQEIKQVFIFDDAFGKYSLSYDSKEWFSRLENIFELADQSHLFIFTSREYVFRQFVNYGNESAREFLMKIIVESHNYSKQEKLSLLGRYTILSPLPDSDKYAILSREDQLTDHKNFSPETIRAFFFNLQFDNRKSQFEKLVLHLDKPDSYLAAVFFNLPSIKQAVLLSVLCAVANNMEVLKKSFACICKDLGLNTLVNASIEFDELNDSILRISISDAVESVSYYHPSMQEFLIRQMVGNESNKLKEVVLMNLNNDLLALSHMTSKGTSIVTKLVERDLCLSKEDSNALSIGMQRLLSNRDNTLRRISDTFNWFAIPQHTLDLQLNDQSYFTANALLLKGLTEKLFSVDFFAVHNKEKSKSWSNLLRAINNSLNQYKIHNLSVDVNPLLNFLTERRTDSDFWSLAFRSLHFITDDQLKGIVGRNWLNGFYIELKKDIDSLGFEVFGDDYPNFHKYYELIKNKVPAEKVKVKPNSTWYPRYRLVEDRIEVLKEIKGKLTGKEILERVIDRYNHINKLKDFAKNRHQFIVGKGWWASHNLS